MDILPKLIIILGLGFDIIGVVLLSYDIIYKPSIIWSIEVCKTKLANARKTRDSINAMNKQLPQPPYTKEKIQVLIDETNAKYEKTKEELMEEMEGLEKEHPKSVFKFGYRGIILVCIGFLLQIVGVILS